MYNSGALINSVAVCYAVAMTGFDPHISISKEVGKQIWKNITAGQVGSLAEDPAKWKQKIEDLHLNVYCCAGCNRYLCTKLHMFTNNKEGYQIDKWALFIVEILIVQIKLDKNEISSGNNPMSQMQRVVGQFPLQRYQCCK